MRKFELKQNCRVYRLAVGLLVGLWAVAPGWVNALPSGGKITSGSGKIQHPSKQDLVIRQNSQQLITNWKEFSIGSTESVTFKQPNSSAVALNRVIGTDPSLILGKLSANGQVFLTNPSGVVFGKGAVVDVHGLLATTLNISDENFLKGNYKFSQDPYRSLATIINNGVINAARYVGLAAPGVVNNGSIIVADLGSVALASGTTATLDFNGDGLISFAVTGEIPEMEDDGENNQGDDDDDGGFHKKRTHKRKPFKGQVTNSGLIRANGGQVLLTTWSAGQVIGSVVNHSGVIEAQTVQQKDGKIILSGGDQGIVQLSGTLDAPNVFVTADAVTVAANKSLSTHNGDINIVANDLDLKGDLNSGTGDVSFTLANGGDLNLAPGNPKGSLGGNDIGHIIAENLILMTNGNINVKGITEKNTDRIVDSVIMKSGKNITFEGVASTFSSLKLFAITDINVNADVTTTQGDFNAVADSEVNGIGDFNVAAGKSLSTKNGDINIVANNMDLKGDVNSGTGDVSFTVADGDDLNLAPGDPDDGLGGDDLGHITAENLILKTDGNINVKGITEENTDGIADFVILESGKNITFEEVASTFSALKLFAITDINVNADITTTQGDFNAVADSEVNGIGDFNVASGVIIASARDIDVNAVNINAADESFGETRDLVLNGSVVVPPIQPPTQPSIDTDSIQQGSLSAFLTDFFQNGGSGC